MRIRILWSMVQVTFGVMAVVTLSGCAFGARNISLQYQPALDVQAKARQSVAVVKFTDTREKPEIGEVRNGYGIKTATVWAKDQDVGAWVANALADELGKAGYDIQKFQDAAPPDAKIAITGSVPEAYVKMFMTQRGTVRVSVSVTKAGVVCLNKEYAGKAGGMAWTASTGEYEKILKKALQDVMKQLVPDVVAAID